jgi:hypothetical protein
MLAGKCGCFARKVASSAGQDVGKPSHRHSRTHRVRAPAQVERVETHRLPGNHPNPPGNSPHINTFKNA